MLKGVLLFALRVVSISQTDSHFVSHLHEDRVLFFFPERPQRRCRRQKVEFCRVYEDFDAECYTVFISAVVLHKRCM